jgi:GMP synthase-like glutamine amidotransferase
MKLGLLQCDDVTEALRPQFGTYPDMFSRLLLGIAPDIQLITYNALNGELPQNINECDGYITTGSQFSVNDNDHWIEELQNFISRLAQHNKKFVGICFGHQLLAKALGGKVEKSERGWGIGVSFNRIQRQKPWMHPSQGSLDLLVSHQDQVIDLPHGVEVLASSHFCPNYMLQYGDHMISIQGHPEFSKEYVNALIERRRDLIPAERVEEGQASLQAPVDDQLMVQWFINFFRY